MHVSVWFLCSSAVGRTLGEYSIVSILYDLMLKSSLLRQEAKHVFELFHATSTNDTSGTSADLSSWQMVPGMRRKQCTPLLESRYGVVVHAVKR